MIFLSKCRALYVVLEKLKGAWHDTREKGHGLEKMAWRRTMLKVARGKAISGFIECQLFWPGWHKGLSCRCFFSF